MTPSQQFTYMRTYSRWIPELARRENYEETTDRFLGFMQEELKLSEVSHATGWNSIIGMEVMPSMRAMWSAGKAAKENNVAMYNCAYLAVSDIQAFSEALLILMCGTGVGFSVERKYTDKLPEISAKFNGAVSTIPVADSKYGWATALYILLCELFAGMEDVATFDLSALRPRGARLETMGGRSSGPLPLQDLFNFCIRLFKDKRAKGQNRLQPIDCLDILNKIAEIVVVGGVRRSSEISLSDLDDRSIAEAKVGQFWVSFPHRDMSNNSAVYHGKPDVIRYMEEFTQLIRSGAGERGIFNRDGARKQMMASGRRKPWDDIGTNPCYSAGTLIHTRNGHFPIERLVGRSVDIWNGHDWQTIDNFRVTGHNQELLKLTMYDGSEESVTPYHSVILEDGQRITARQLVVGDSLMKSTAPLSHGSHGEPGAYVKGFLVGDGTLFNDRTQAGLFVYEPKMVCSEALINSTRSMSASKPRTNAICEVGLSEWDEDNSRCRLDGLSLYKELIPWCREYKERLPKEIFQWDKSSKLLFITGAMDADGCASDTTNGFMYQISSIHKGWLQDFQTLLKTVGVVSKIALNKEECSRDFNDGYGEYQSKVLWRLTISQRASIELAKQVKFSRLVSFADKTCKYRVNGKSNIVVSIEPLDKVPVVYCCTVEGSHSIALSSGFQYGQCGEIILRDKEFCNLSEVVVRSNDTLQTLRHKVRVAAMFGSCQATFTNFKGLRPKWKENCDEERLLGVSLTGIMDHPVLNNVNDKAKKWLGELKSTAINETEKWCKQLGINMSAAITCVKPSGTVSQLVDAASGIHPRHALHYIRRYRISATDPLFRMMRDQGVPWNPEVGEDPDTASTMVLDFPIAAPKGAKTRNDMTARQQLEHWQMVKEFWCEHNPSITVSVEEHEWPDTAAWVYNNFDDICGVSFLPKTNHIYQLAPYEEIEESVYKQRAASFPVIDYSKLSQYEQEDNTQGSQSYACIGDRCEV